MRNFDYIQFGRLAPPDAKVTQNNIYSLSTLGLTVPEVVEVELPVPPGLVSHYNQGNIGACTGYSASWMSSINNYPAQGAIKYDAYWLYKRGQQTDGDPGTSGDNDGGYVWAVMDVLRKEGHKLSGGAVGLAEGIQSYYWCKTVDDIRTAFSLRRCPVFGIRWYSSFNTPQLYNGEYWIGRQSSWGSLLGGHAICSFCGSDMRDAFRWINTWGPEYPDVWISYKSVEKLLKSDGECAVGIDRPEDTPVPPIEIPIQIALDGVRYAGRVAQI